ncbi:hypothetical protein L3X38_025320 [Prunus dulcis]|uniref:Uncharacterized protein n=1 Tax=Prunus dulcis TaxID=3755 RepID=A0AAD4W3C2_PRUDU|nr:hypothetical protein L3X38_025320 [Prunus dulcis]
MASFLIDSSFAKRKPASNASDSTSLLEAGKPSVIACSNKVPSGVTMTTPAPAPFWFNSPSTRNCHMSLGLVRFREGLVCSQTFLLSFSSSADGVNSATKSAKA